ncbi:AAA family ATPase [Yersinia enterocolitica]|uniref:AAA family ATPase n=2 Tax=Yersinia enterocolitica TaxID=630 RepID=UPI0005E9E9C5|nr:ATP-binding protein [Yersinia enterocolitica]EKN3682143.1 ATP-binding protein [Yersinia enterocolitica]EKN4188718.1 ATP-binding protein [Yersinia enterocolitica]EKN4192298.1 ATP-binding protein [Yersinia enterocolitica]ELI7903886.1 ATP-binding protein [Yersinia enterocolitica]CQH31643.1 Predicted ATPase [Yersinia enterocolitica]
MSNMLRGFAFSGYRSIGDNLVKISPLKKINFIIGQNNIGKSNIINFLANHYSRSISAISTNNSFRGTDKFEFDNLDRHISDVIAHPKISFPLSKIDIEKYIETLLPNNTNDMRRSESQIREAQRIARKLFASSYFDRDIDGSIWFHYEASDVDSKPKKKIDIVKAKNNLTDNEWYSIWICLTYQSGGDINNNWIPETLNMIYYLPPKINQIEVIPAIRKIGKAGGDATDYSGEGIIDRLAKIQNPPLHEQDKLLKFNAVNKFLQNVLENSTATINIPYDRDMILVKMDGITLPLESLGTGVHEVIILAAAATLLEKTIVCIEEPELHLHPLLQKKLIKYLSLQTNNQYIFTTHSAHLLDAVESEIFHVTKVNGITNVESVANTKKRAEICNDLGYKASDILQSNCIVWVEGPSDRIYLNYWINQKNKNLIEGIHYSIMFYGGKLFSHLTALDYQENETEIKEFISVRNLNRNSIIMFDSDKSSAQSHLNETKKRLQTEFNSGPGFAWVTKGREVENYLSEDNIEASIQAIHANADTIENRGAYSNLLKFKKKNVRNKKNGDDGNHITTANKVNVAKYYVENFNSDLSKLDLEEQVTKLCNFISKCN